MKTFEHGGNIKEFAQQNNCSVKQIVDLSSNINFLKPKHGANFNTLDISAYPNYTKLYKKVGQHYKVKKNQLEFFNGGSSAIFSLFRILALKECVIYSPAYLEYKKAAKVHNYKLHIINRFENLYDNIPKNSLVIFVNPSTPDGQYYNIDKLLKLWKKNNCTVLIDESFIEFTNKKSLVSYIKSYDNLYILKSMTKIFSAAGIRVGTLLSTKKNIKNIKNFEPLWKISEFYMHYLLQVLKDKNFVQKTKNKTTQNRKRLISTVQKHPLVKKVFKSHANYILVKLQNICATKLQEKLAKHNIMIRNGGNFDCLDDSYVRIAVKSKKSIKQLQTAIKSI